MSKEYTFEPDVALFGGPDGLQFVRRLLRGCAERLNEGGRVVIEMGDITGERFRDLYPTVGGEWYCHPESGQPVVLILNQAQCELSATLLG